METKHCPDCDMTKPVTDFYYLKHRNKYNKRCKPCHQILSKGYAGKSKIPEHEVYVVSELNKRGIVSDHAKNQHNDFKFVDVLSWGCVRIECKLLSITSRSNYGGYASSNTEKQRKHGFLADVVCIVFNSELYLFKPSHPAFYIDGKLRTRILYNPDSERVHITKNRKLTFDDMELAHNRFELIEHARLSIAKSRMNNE